MNVTRPTVIVGFGRMAQGYADDPAMARHFRYAAHSQVLRDNPRFAWCAVVDPSPKALEVAKDTWSIPHVAGNAAALGHDICREIEVAVLATGPEAREGLLDQFPRLKAVIAEKPLGRTAEEAHAFLAECRAREIIVQVNMWRRADERFRELADGRLDALIGEVQAATCYYGNGLANNGTHMVDFVRMLLGEVAGWQLSGIRAGFIEGPIPGDANPAFMLHLASGLEVAFQPLRFSDYRECGLTLMGRQGKLDILVEGLHISFSRRVEHRAMSGEREIASDRAERLPATCGDALYRMYDNLADCLDADDAAMLWSDADSAMRTTAIIDAIRLADAHRRADGND